LERALARDLEGLDFRGRVREAVERDFVVLDVVERDLRVERLEDFFAPDRFDFVSPFSRRILFTVRAATSSARPP